MEISSLKALLESISLYIKLSNFDSIKSEPNLKYYEAGEEILMLLKPILDSVLHTELTIDEALRKELEELHQTVEDLKDYFGGWQPLSSKVYFIIQVELLLSQIRSASIGILQSLKSLDYDLPEGLTSASIEHYAEKIKHAEYEQASSLIKDAARDQVDGVGPSSEMLAKIAEILNLKSNQEILIEAVALEKLKESAERAEKMEEVEFIEQLIALVTCMHERLIVIKQAQSSSPVPIPADFCCPLSLELMTDPVIVASGQTYERAFIRKWLELGLTVCPKTRQTLTHTNLIPNYTVKALIANWCESNNVKLPDPLKSMSLNQPSPLLAHADSEVLRESSNGSRSNPPMSPEPAQTRGSSPVRSLIGMPRSPLHPRSASDSLPRTVGNRQSLDIGRSTSGESSNTLEDSADLDGLKEPNAEELIGRSHKRAVSASSAQPNGGYSQEAATTDTNGSCTVSTQLTDYSSDASGEMKSELRAAAVAAPQREPEFPSRLETRTRNNPIWRRPTDRLSQRMVSSAAAEARPDLSGIETEVKKHVEGLQSDSVLTQREATCQIRLLARNNMENRIVIANCGAITLLVGLLRSEDLEVQENAVTALLNLSINDNNKIAIANADAIEPLIHVLETGSPEAKENSAATLFSLSVIEENKIKIGRSGAIGPLVDLLGNGTARGKKDAATALFNLSIYHENKGRIVQAGAVKYLVDLMDPAAGMVDKAVAVLANLATIPEGRTAIGQENGISVLVEVVELGSARGKENAAAALLHLCTNSSRYCNMVLQEGAVPPLVALSQTGTPRAKEKAQALLSYFRNQRHGNGGRG